MTSYERHAVTPVVDILVGDFCGSRAGYAELLTAMHHITQNTTEYVGMTRFGLMCARRDSRYPQALFRQALHLRNCIIRLRRNGAQEFRLYGHSMGGAVAIIAADAFGQKLGITQVVALNPAGMYVDGFMPLAKRMIAKGRQDLHDAQHHKDARVRRIIRAGRPGALLYLSNPARSLAEGIALSNTPLFSQLLPNLARTSTRVMIGYSSQDIVFLREQMIGVINTFPGVEAFLLESAHDVQYTPHKTVRNLHSNGAI